MSFVQLFLIILAVFAFKFSVIDNNNIASSSMVPTLQVGDYVLVNKMRYSLRFPFFDWEIWQWDQPDRGDVITFLPPGSKNVGNHYVKRVIGLPNETIRLQTVPACQWVDELECTSKNQEDLLIMAIHIQEAASSTWKKMKNRAIPDRKSTKILHDSDDAGFLGIVTGENDGPWGNIPVVQSKVLATPMPWHSEEKDSFFITESSLSYGELFLCPTIRTQGCQLGPDQFFVMGDNRDNSEDSRIIGFIDRADIRGKAQFIYFSINWRDGICQDYWSFFGSRLPSSTETRPPTDNLPSSTDVAKVGRSQTATTELLPGFRLPEFDPKQQKKYCSALDSSTPSRSFFTGLGNYFYHTFKYRIPRMKVRWTRIGSFIR